MDGADRGNRLEKVYRPTEQSLDLAAKIAEATGFTFDREATRALGSDLYDRMFADLLRILKPQSTQPFLHTGVFSHARAFSARTLDGDHAVGLDMVFDYWIFSLTHLVAICTFTVPDEEAREYIAADLTDLFELLGQPARYEQSRERQARYLLDSRFNSEILKLCAVLARAMTVFVLCHEIAHHTLGHVGAQDDHPEMEMEADAKAVEYFFRVVEYGAADRDTHVHIDPKIAGAPLVLSMILELYEAWLKAHGVPLDEVSNHPSAERRTAQLQTLMQDRLNDTALEIVVGATYAITDLHRLLGLPVPNTGS